VFSVNSVMQIFKKMKLHYEIVNDGDDPAILYMHGFMGSAADWRPVIKRIDSSFRHLAVDLPGHGRSLNLPSYDAPATMTALLAVLDKLAIGQPLLVGYSMGGRLALRLALEHPQRFKALVLESASAGLKSAAGREARRQSDRQIALELERSNYREFLERWYRQPLFGGLTQRADFDRLMEKRLRNNPPELAKALRGLSVAEQPSLWDRLEEIELPTLLLCGERDEKYRQISEEMQRRNLRFKRVVIADSAHNTHFEQCGIFAREVKAFLDKFGFKT